MFNVNHYDINNLSKKDRNDTINNDYNNKSNINYMCGTKKFEKEGSPVLVIG